MASVVGFWMLPEEEARFLAWLRETGPLAALPHSVVRRREEIVPLPFDEVIATDPTELLVGLEKYSGDLQIDAGKDAGGPCFSASVQRSCYVAYQRGRIVASKKLSMGSLSAHASYFGEGGEQFEKPADFVKWYKRVFKWVKDATPLWHRYKTYRITEQVAKAVQDGWELVP